MVTAEQKKKKQIAYDKRVAEVAASRAGTGPKVEAIHSNKKATGTKRISSSGEVEEATGKFAEEKKTIEKIPAKEVQPQTRASVINLDKPKTEKTGISKLREEDSTVGALVRAATDWRTTVGLVATLGTLGIGAAVIGGAGASAATTGVAARAGTGVVGRITSMKMAHQVSKFTGGLIPKGTVQAQKAIIGKSPAVASGVGKLFSIGGFKAVATNPKTQALTIGHLAKSGMAIGAAAFVVKEAADTYPFARFELAEAADKIGIAIFTAAGAGNAEEVARLTEILNEIVNPDVWDKVIGLLPGANVLQAASKNVAAAQVSAASILKSSQKKLADAQAKAEEPSFEEERVAGEERARERELERREEDTEYFDKQREEADERKEEQREEDKVHWADIEAKRVADKETERAADDAYWKKITEENAKRKADDRAADEAYWKEIKEKNTTEPWTPADKAVVDNWNAGKSALNFGWLFS